MLNWINHVIVSIFLATQPFLSLPHPPPPDLTDLLVKKILQRHSFCRYKQLHFNILLSCNELSFRAQ